MEDSCYGAKWILKRKKYLSTEVTVTSLFSVLSELLPSELGDELFLVVLCSAR